MPILVKDYTWEETEKHVFITVPLKGVMTNKVDILTTEEYIKVRILILSLKASLATTFFVCSLIELIPKRSQL